MLPAICKKTPEVYNPLNNSLLETEVEAYKLAKSTTWYNLAYTVTCVAIWGITLAVTFYVAINFPVWAVLATGVTEAIAIKLILEHFLAGLSKAVEQRTEEYLLENEVCLLTTHIKNEAQKAPSTQKYIKQRAAAIGVFKRDQATNLHLKKEYSEKSDILIEKSLIPILARAERCHREAALRLKEIRDTFYSIPEDAEKNPYQDQINRLSKDDARAEYVVKDVRSKVRQFEAIKATKRKEYLEWRIRDIFAAYVYKNPAHSGRIEEVGHLTTEADLFDYLLESREDVRDTLFAFSPFIKEITRNRLEKLEKELFLSYMRRFFYQLQPHMTSGVEITTGDAEQRDFGNTSKELVRDLLSKHNKEITTIEEFDKLVMKNYMTLFADDAVIAVVRQGANKHYIQVFERYDATSEHNKFVRILINLSKFDKSCTPHAWRITPETELITLAEKYIGQINTLIESRKATSIRDLVESDTFQRVVSEFRTEYLTKNR